MDRPKITHFTLLPGALKEDALRVIVARDGKVFLGPSLVARGDLTEMIRDGVRNGAEKKVYVAADARVKYIDVASALEEVRLAGINNVAFLTETSR